MGLGIMEKHNTVPVRPASSVLVWREGPHGIEVFCGIRNPSMTFAAGQIAFPGGRLERHDARAKALSPLSSNTKALLAYQSRHKPHGLAQAGLRELMEETGLVIGQHEHNKLQADFSALSFLCRAITPPGRVRRFDARFFAAPSHAVQTIIPPTEHEELLDLQYRPITALLEDKLMPPTKLALMQLRDLIAGEMTPKLMRGMKRIETISISQNR